MSQALTDNQRKQIHDFALDGRKLLTREAQELLEGVYGLYPDGRMEPPEKLPQVQHDPETEGLYYRLKRFLADEVQAGLPPDEAVAKLVKEIAFTHLNRLVAFKMMEARKLIRGTVDKGVESNGFKFYLADHADDYALFQQGQIETAYRHFLLWQCDQVAQEIKVLFDPHALPGRIFPRSRPFNELLSLLNAPELAAVWQAEETIGWLYQYFNEQEKAEVFDRLYKQKQKIRRQDIPAATQLFTPNWIVRFLVQNTLGRLWVQMHPDSELLGSNLLDYLVPLQGEVPPEALRPVREITLLDPACGTMHFGLVAFDLFAAMYREELARAGEPGWPVTPSVNDEAEIPAAIIAHNLFGIDIDLRAVQLSALTLYLKAKGLNKEARITDSNLACADVLPLNGARLGSFIKEMHFTRPVYERLIRALWARLQDVNQLGSLLRLEKELGELIAAERARYRELPLFAGVPGEFERAAAEEEFWEIIYAQVIQGLDEFARQQAQAGADQTFFTGEATKGLRLLNVMLSRYDVVVTNPPYSGKRNLNDRVAACLDNDYKDAKGDLYAAFIQRCAEFTVEGGRLGMITQQSFMFLSSYEQLRANLRAQFAIETMAHTGPRAFAEIGGEKVNTAVFVLRQAADEPQRKNSVGSYFRLVQAAEGDGKRLAFEHALQDGRDTYRVAQHRFEAIPREPWIYWISDSLRDMFITLPKLEKFLDARAGMHGGDRFRFARLWWEVGKDHISFGCNNLDEAFASMKKWIPYMKGGPATKWYGNQDYVIAFDPSHYQILSESGNKLPSRQFFFREGLTWSDVSSKGFAARLSPGGFIFDAAGISAFMHSSENIGDLYFFIALLNSKIVTYFLSVMNPTIHFQAGDISRLPIPQNRATKLATYSYSSIRLQAYLDSLSECTTHFIVPFRCKEIFEDLSQTQERIRTLQDNVNEEAFMLYEINSKDRTVVETEIVGDSVGIDIEEPNEDSNEVDKKEDINHAISWISFALGVIVNCFCPGNIKQLGSAVYRREDFAIGSLPDPSEAEFDELVGPPDRFAYVDEAGGRHVFPAAVEQALRALAVPDGITVLDAGHPRDLPTLVDKALRLMLGDTAAQEVIEEGAGGDLRKFLERDFFTKWHLKWYRKRPIYWPLQSANRSYGFVLFHEKIDKQTLYVLQRNYLDAKLNGLRQHIADLRGQMAAETGAARKRLEREVEKSGKIVEEVAEFAATMERITRHGYEPEPNWIDDGVILRLAPLWQLIPIWKTEPKKYWERLEAGDFDWSHIAMRYWPQRVREACRRNKSFAIAHGHESWYEGVG